MPRVIRPAVIFDIDGTLAILTPEREAMLKERRFGDYFEELGAEAPNLRMRYLLKSLSIENAIIISTGRPIEFEDVTTRWLRKYHMPFSVLLMRDNNTERDREIKRKHIQEVRSSGYTIIGMFDDRPSVIKMAREEGILALHCAEGY